MSPSLKLSSVELAWTRIVSTLARFTQTETEVVVGPAEDEVRFWILARKVALETTWDEDIDIGA